MNCDLRYDFLYQVKTSTRTLDRSLNFKLLNCHKLNNGKSQGKTGRPLSIRYVRLRFMKTKIEMCIISHNKVCLTCNQRFSFFTSSIAVFPTSVCNDARFPPSRSSTLLKYNDTFFFFCYLKCPFLHYIDNDAPFAQATLFSILRLTEYDQLNHTLLFLY